MATRKNDPVADQDEKTPPLADFEKTLAAIETTVRQLEGGELTLAQSLERYEVAVGQMRQCYTMLEDAERKISVLSGFDADGNPVKVPVDQAVGDSTLPEKQKSRGQRRGAAKREDSDELF